MTTAERLEQARASLGLTQAEWAEKLDTPLRTYSYYANGKRPPAPELLTALAGLGFNVNWILTGLGHMRAGADPALEQMTEPEIRKAVDVLEKEARDIRKRYNAVPGDAEIELKSRGIPARLKALRARLAAVVATDEARRETSPTLSSEFVLLPRFEAKAAAGGGLSVQSEQVVDFLAFKSTWVHNTLRRNPANLILVEAAGDSMEPTIFDGDLLLVDTAENRVRDYGIYVLSLNGDLLVKRIQRMTTGDLVIMSDNDRYPNEPVSAPAAEQLRFVGRVVWRGGMVLS